MKTSRCLIFLGVVVTSEAMFKNVIGGGRNLTKGAVLKSASGASAGMGVANSAVQFGTKSVSRGANEGAEVSNILLTGATAVTGLSVATAATHANKAIEAADNVLEKIPLVGNTTRLGTQLAKKSVSSVNLILGQSSLSAVDNIGISSIELGNRVLQIGAKGTSGASTVGTGLTQTGLALGATAANTGVDLAANGADKVVNRLIGANQTEENSLIEILIGNFVQAVQEIVPHLATTIESRM